MIEAAEIAYTGSTGSIGSCFPKACMKLQTRLEDSVEARSDEIKRLSHPPQVLIHLSGMINVQDCEKNPELALQLNVEGSRRWYLAAQRLKIPHFIFASTSHVYAPPKDRKVLSVHSELGPINAYARSKLAAENALQELSLAPKSPKLTIARIFSVLSKLDRPGFVSTAFRDRARRKDFSPIPGFNNIRDFMTAEKVVEELLELAKSEIKFPPVVHICSGIGTTVGSIAIQIFKEHGLDPSSLTEAVGAPSGPPFIVGEPNLQLRGSSKRS